MGYPYEFKREDAERFALFVGIKARQHGDELVFQYCPYCRQKTTGKDRNKFAINLLTGQYNCFRSSCNAHGNMITLAKDFKFELSKDFENYYRPKKQYRTFKKPAEPIKPLPPAISYLESRGISRNIAERYEITTAKDRDNILMFPFFDDKGNLVSFKYRKMDFDKEKDNAKEWFEKDCKPILFGMKQCNLKWGKTLVICEGQIDSLSCAEAGIVNAVSVPTGANGFTWIPFCWDFVNKFEEIVVFGDHEKGRITLLDEISQRFPLKIFHVRPEDYRDCKDANDILRKYGKDAVKACVENAVQIPVKDVVDLADVEDVDIFGIEKCPTGIKELDRLLYGGLPFGGVHIISAKSGSGKSTFASQILINAREKGYRCFAYSGELPNFLFKGWMSFQVAGRNHIYEYQNDLYGNIHYNISDINKRIISEWYRDYIYLYDNKETDTQEQKSLVEIIEATIQQYNVRVILLDNLMTAMTMEKVRGSDTYERQTDFVNKLRSLAVKYNVMIILIAHKRKNNFSQDENDEIAGSSNIANLAMLIMTYERSTDCAQNERMLRVPKNRLFGRIETEGIKLRYDEKSKRIYGSGDNLDREFGCFTEPDVNQKPQAVEPYMDLSEFEDTDDPIFE